MSSHSNSTLLEEFDLLVLESMSDRTKTEYLLIIKQFERFQGLRNKTFEQSTAIDLAAFLKNQKNSCTGSTLQLKFYAIKKFYKFLRRKQIMKSEELEFLEDIRPKATKGDEAHRALTDEEVKQCQERISHPIFRFVYFLGIEFGLRREEYTRIKISDINFQKRLLRIHGKGNKIRFIPIAERLIPRFKQFLKQRERDQIQHEFFLYSKTGKTTKKTIGDYFQQMKSMSGVEFTSHDLRVTFATRYWKLGMDILVISKKLGHSSIETTLTYVKPTEKEINARFLEIAESYTF